MIGAEVKPDTNEAPSEIDRKKHLRLSGVKNKDLLEVEIIKGNKKPEYYEHLSRSLSFLDVKDMAKTAIKYNNPKALISMMKTNLYAASSALSTEEGAEFLSKQEQSTQGNMLVQMFFMVRTATPLKYRIIMRRLARNVILKTSLKIAGRGMQKGMKRKRVPYYPGMDEFDLQMTLSNLIEHGIHSPEFLSYRDIVGIQRTQVKKNVVLILDTSGSMYGRSLLNAALTTSVLSYIMDKHEYSVILFNSNTMVMKKMTEEIPVVSIIDQILDSEAVGFTNIEIGLEKGLEQLENIKGTNKFGVLVSDGAFNRGKDPVIIAKKYPLLHVVGMPPAKNELEGLITCKKIAQAGKGSYIPVSNYYEIPRALMTLLHSSK